MTTPLVYTLTNIDGFIDLLNDTPNEQNIIKLNKVECRTDNNIANYKIIGYNKSLLTRDLIPTVGLCRSVILNRNNMVVGFAPPKSIKWDEFIQKYSEDDTCICGCPCCCCCGGCDKFFSPLEHGTSSSGSNGVPETCIVAEEFVEGTMINVFWDDSIGLTGGWEIATRNTVGATSSFYKGTNTKTFRDMFLEAATENRLVMDNLDKELCYSFVLQHPENRIVVPFARPRLYLVAVYSITNEPGNVYVTVHDSQTYKEAFYAINTTVSFPEIYSFDKYQNLIEQFGSATTAYNIVGVVLHNKSTGERAKIRNPVYEHVRKLRGNQPKLQYHYLCLRKEGHVGNFLKYFPENKAEFSKFREQLHVFTNTLFSNYISCYIKKEKPLIEFHEQYRTHMFNIHNKYLTELKESHKFVTKTVVINHVNNIHPSLLMYCLNLQMRQLSDVPIIVDLSVD